MTRQKWLENVLSSIGKALITTDAMGSVTFMNEHAADMTGYGLEEVEGMNLNDLLKLTDPATNKRISFHTDEIAEQALFMSSDQGLLLERKDGAYHCVTYTISPIRAEEGTVGVVAVLCLHDLSVCTPERNQLLKKHERRPFNDFFFVKKDGNFIRLRAQEIQWIEAKENYVLVSTGEDRYLVHATMKSLAEKLEPHGFQRVHRSYIVPVGKIHAIEENKLKIGEASIPIGKSYRSDLMKTLNFF